MVFKFTIQSLGYHPARDNYKQQNGTGKKPETEPKFESHYDLVVNSTKGRLSYELQTGLNIRLFDENGSDPVLSILDRCHMTPRRVIDRQKNVLEDPAQDFIITGVGHKSNCYLRNVRRWLSNTIRRRCGKAQVLNIH
ncbi:MAG: hypothetical protein NT076_03245 [Candidatus Pacearchaeota archaeon]|nr:hypothetical protein [Candidatus Pacearchaeota archaeon]